MSLQLLDLSGFQPAEVEITLKSRKVTVSLDILPAYADRAYAWLQTYISENIDQDDGYEIASVIIGVDVAEVKECLGLMGVATLLRFFAETFLNKQEMGLSASHYVSPELSTEESLLANSSEVLASSK